MQLKASKIKHCSDSRLLTSHPNVSSIPASAGAGLLTVNAGLVNASANTIRKTIADDKSKMLQRFPKWLLAPVIYLVVASLLLLLPLNRWFALHIYYAISWPASELLHNENFMIETVGGVIQYAIISGMVALLMEVLRRPR